MNKKKNTLITVAAFLLTVLFAAASFYYRKQFIIWKHIPLTYTFFSITVISPALVGLLGMIKKGRYEGNPKKRAGITVGIAALFGITSFLITLIINNVIGHAQLNELAAGIAVGVTSLMFIILLIVSLTSKGKKLSPAALAFAVGTLAVFAVVALAIYVKPFMEQRKMEARLAAPSTVSAAQWGEQNRIGQDADFYISISGSDENDGSYEHPFATFEKAAEAVRALDKNGRDGISVGVFPGEYRTKGIVLNEEDSGTESCPVTYGVTGEGECFINAGISLSPADFEAVSDEETRSRLSAEAVDKIRVADLSKYGITADDYGKIYAIGSYNTASKYTGDYVGPLYCELFVNDTRMNLARYPDSGFLETDRVISTGYGRETDGATTARADYDEITDPESDVYGISSKLAQRIASWKTLDDVWMFGFWKYDWADASTPIGEFNLEKKTLSPKFVSVYGTKEKAPYYFFNVFEELDAPGEWYLDRENGLLYVYADDGFDSSTIDLSLGTDSVLTGNSLSYVTFDGFTFKGTRGDGIVITGNSDTIRNCLIKNVAGNAVYMSGSNNLVTRCEITHTGKGGIALVGGDPETLTAGNSRADNNFIHDWSEIYQTYQPAVTLGGVGNICSHNEIYNSPHEAITYGGNNHVIEYNVIHDVCLLSDDAGAIYTGRRWDYYGNVIRYNCIYNAGSGEHRPNGIYWDDALSGQTAYGNLLVNIPQCGFELGGGRDYSVTNNILVNCNDKSISYDQRAIDGVFGGWFNHSSQAGGDMWTNLEASPYKSEIWQKAFPQMTKFSDDFNDTDNPDFVPNPSYSDVSGNLIVNYRGNIGNIEEKAEKYSSIENNAIYKLTEIDSIFTDAANGDYSLKKDSPVYDLLPGFEELPLAEMGRYASAD